INSETDGRRRRVTAFVETQADGVWIDGYTPPAADYADLDAKTFAAINGDRGGTWAPTSGLHFTGAGSEITGPTVVAHGGELRTTDGARFVLADGDWPLFAVGHAQRTRTIVQALHRRTVFADFGTPAGGAGTP